LNNTNFYTGLPAELNDTMNLISDNFQQVKININNLEAKLNKALYIQVSKRIVPQYFFNFKIYLFLHISHVSETNNQDWTKIYGRCNFNLHKHKFK
jgi:hypothetical protein